MAVMESTGFAVESGEGAMQAEVQQVAQLEQREPTEAIKTLGDRDLHGYVGSWLPAERQLDDLKFRITYGISPRTRLSELDDIAQAMGTASPEDFDFYYDRFEDVAHIVYAINRDKDTKERGERIVRGLSNLMFAPPFP